MRYRDQPTVEVTQRVRCDVPAAWALVTDIGLSARCSSELREVEWLDGHRYSDGSTAIDWVVVQFGDDDLDTRIILDRDQRRRDGYAAEDTNPGNEEQP